MLRITERRVKRLLLLSSLPVALALPLSLAAQDRAATRKAPAAVTAVAAEDDDKTAPPYHEYKGVRIGMTADEARKKLGDPADKGDKQDFYAFGENESAQIFYDSEKKVFAVSVIYLNGGSGAPTCKSVLGMEVEAKADGSLHRKIDYPKAGFWVACSRTQGDAPMVTITMQKKM